MDALPDQWRNVTEWAALAAEANTSASLAAASLREAEQERVDAEADLAQKLETQGGSPPSLLPARVPYVPVQYLRIGQLRVTVLRL